MIFSFYVYYRNQKLIYAEEFVNPSTTDNVTGIINATAEAKLIYGVLVTLKSLSQTIGCGITGETLPIQSFNSFTTPKYKLHCLEVGTGYYFVCTSESNGVLDYQSHLRQIYQQIFCPIVLRLPGYKIGDYLGPNTRFGREVSAFFARINGGGRVVHNNTLQGGAVFPGPSVGQYEHYYGEQHNSSSEGQQSTSGYNQRRAAMGQNQENGNQVQENAQGNVNAHQQYEIAQGVHQQPQPPSQLSAAPPPPPPRNPPRNVNSVPEMGLPGVGAGIVDTLLRQDQKNSI